MTFSIVARSDDGQSWGVAVASRFLAVGQVVPAAVAGTGAIATQATANVRWKYTGMSLLDDGHSAVEVVRRLVAEDEEREHRQIGVVDGMGVGATYTGAECMDWAGGLAEPGLAIQGNILTGPEVIEAMKQSWEATRDLSLAHRLLAALTAGDAAGGDRRGRQAASLLVVSEGAGYGGGDDVAVDLRVDDHVEPISELARLLELNDFYFTPPEPRDRVPVDTELAAELARRSQKLGHADFEAWVGTANYEMRVADDGSWVDRRVLDILRGS